MVNRLAIKGLELKQFTPDVQVIMKQAVDVAKSYHHHELMPIHVAYVLFVDQKSYGSQIYGQLPESKFNPTLVLDAINHALASIPQAKAPYGSIADENLSQWPSLCSLAQGQLDEPKGLFNGHDLLLGMWWVYGVDAVFDVLTEQAGITEDMLTTYLQQVNKKPDKRSKSAKKTGEDVLAKYGTDLVQVMATGEHDPVIGRDNEVLQMEKILSRKTKNNPILIGEPGVGKTAIIEGLAQRIVNGDVPSNLQKKRIISIDLSALVAGASYSGEFEERFKQVLAAIKADSAHIIAFIDEIHMIMGAGQSGTMDAGNMLKPMLARGELHLIGATTTDEYKQYLEKDKALTRRFQEVMVAEPSTDDAITILRGLRERFEIYHNVRIHDAALVAAVTLSKRYINDRYLPDKAIDLVDTACSSIRVALNSAPPELDEVQRNVMRLKVEAVGLAQETDRDSKRRLKEVQAEQKAAEQRLSQLKTLWNQEKGQLQRQSNQKAALDKARHDLVEAEQNNQLEKAAQLQKTTIPELEAELNTLENSHDAPHLISESVTEAEIAKVVAQRTGIPAEKVGEGEQQKLLHLADTLHQRVIGQDEAVNAVTKTVIRSRAGLNDPNKPLGSFLFMGPTGVGKTELAKALAQALFDSEDALLRFDMSEYMEKESVQSLIGAPPGYVGYEAGGKLTEAVRHQSYAIVLFDEVEKAHPDIFNILLQVLDDGRLTDNHDRHVDFKNTIIIMTSNLGADVIADSFAQHGQLTEAAQAELLAAERSQFRPELLNRLSGIIMFSPLTLANMGGIVDKQISILSKRLARQQIQLKVMPSAHKWLATNGFDPANGARPMGRLITEKVEDPLSYQIIAGKLKSPCQVMLGLQDNQLRFKVAPYG